MHDYACVIENSIVYSHVSIIVGAHIGTTANLAWIAEFTWICRSVNAATVQEGKKTFANVILNI